MSRKARRDFSTSCWASDMAKAGRSTPAAAAAAGSERNSRREMVIEYLLVSSVVRIASTPANSWLRFLAQIPPGGCHTYRPRVWQIRGLGQISRQVSVFANVAKY